LSREHNRNPPGKAIFVYGVNNPVRFLAISA